MVEMTFRIDKSKELYKEDLRNALDVKNIERLKGKKVLITGATGLIGVCMIDSLMSLGGVSVVAVGRDKGRAKERLGEYFDNPLFSFLEQDVTEPFPDDLTVDYVIPAASNTHPLAYSKYPVETMMVNLKGAENALKLSVRCGAVVLYPSTVEVYGNAVTSDDVFDESYTGRLNLATSRSSYPESKRASEAMCLSYISEYGAKVRIVRLCRVLGPTMLESDSKVASQFVKNVLAGENIVLKSEGNQYFSYVYVADAVSAMLYVMLNGEDGEAYNISSKDCDVHLKDLAGICAEINGGHVVFDLPSDVERKGYSIAVNAITDNSKLLSAGWKPKYNIEDAVRRTVEILR